MRSGRCYATEQVSNQIELKVKEWAYHDGVDGSCCSMEPCVGERDGGRSRGCQRVGDSTAWRKEGGAGGQRRCGGWMAEVSVASVRDGGRKAEMDEGTELRLLGVGVGCGAHPDQAHFLADGARGGPRGGDARFLSAGPRHRRATVCKLARRPHPCGPHQRLDALRTAVAALGAEWPALLGLRR